MLFEGSDRGAFSVNFKQIIEGGTTFLILDDFQGRKKALNFSSSSHTNKMLGHFVESGAEYN